MSQPAIRTVADLRRAARPGTVLLFTEHAYPELNGRRTVVRSRSRSFSSRLPVTHPRYAEVVSGSWLDFPRADQVTANPDGSIRVRGLCTIALAPQEV
jgi:hypothetical protein